MQEVSFKRQETFYWLYIMSKENINLVDALFT